jgi:hypothetical protein
MTFFLAIHSSSLLRIYGFIICGTRTESIRTNSTMNNDGRLYQWFQNFFGSRTTWKNLVVREGQNID